MKFLSILTATFISCCSLSASEPSSGVTQPKSEKTEQAAREVVKRYYAEIERGHYEVAYQLWEGAGFTSGKNLHDFTAGFAQTMHVSVVAGAPTDGEGTPGSLHVTIPVRITAVLKDGTRQQYVGKYMMRRCNDVPGCTIEDRRWHIKSASLHVAR